MCLAQRPQRSDAGEAWTHCPSVSSQALYHWATALPLFKLFIDFNSMQNSDPLKIKFWAQIWNLLNVLMILGYGILANSADQDEVSYVIRDQI